MLRGEDSELPDRARRGRFGPDQGRAHREAREKIQHSALSADAVGRVLFIYGAQALNGSSANADAQDHGGAARRRAVFADGVQHGRRAATIRSRCAAYMIAPVETGECAGRPARGRARAGRAPGRRPCLFVRRAHRHGAGRAERPGRKGRPRRRARAVPPCAGARHLPRGRPAGQV